MLPHHDRLMVVLFCVGEAAEMCRLSQENTGKCR